MLESKAEAWVEVRGAIGAARAAVTRRRAKASFSSFPVRAGVTTTVEADRRG